MSRRFLPALWAFTLLFLMMQVSAQAATYVVAPFNVSGAQGYSYLGQAVPSMLTSRLFLQGQFEPSARQDAALKEKAPASREAAAAMAKKYGADYIIWGDITVMGDQASLDVSALSPKGSVWKNSAASPVNGLIAGLQNVADSVNIEVFGRTDVKRAAGTGSLNSAFVVNDTTGRQYGNVKDGAYLNPSLRYQGTETSSMQMRSQMLSYEVVSTEIADVDGDGRNDVLMLTPNDLFVYDWKGDNRLEQKGKYRLPSTMRPILVRMFKADGHRYIILTGNDESTRTADSQVLEFSKGKFKVVVKHCERYLNVVKVPPLYMPVLVGQDPDRSKTVSGRVYEVTIEGNEVVRRGNIGKLPKKANVFNFSWIPADEGKKGDHVVLVMDNETLATFDSKGTRVASTEDIYSGSSVSVVGDRSIGTLDTDDDNLVMYYVPMRMPVVDLDRDGRHELIANKPVTTAGKLFSNYRTYPQGEIHAMLWDGMGLDLLWKTRRIKGTVSDVNIADIDNNGKLDLVVSVNAFGGVTTGMKTRCALYVYPLDTTQVKGKPNYQE